MFCIGGTTFTGPYQASHAQAEVRIKVWGLCNLPTAKFTISGSMSISTCTYFLINIIIKICVPKECSIIMAIIRLYCSPLKEELYIIMQENTQMELLFTNLKVHLKAKQIMS